MDMSGTPIAEGDRPQVRDDQNSNANVVQSGRKLGQVASKASASGTPLTASARSSRTLALLAALCAVAGMAAGALISVRWKGPAVRTPERRLNSSEFFEGSLPAE